MLNIRASSASAAPSPSPTRTDPAPSSVEGVPAAGSLEACGMPGLSGQPLPTRGSVRDEAGGGRLGEWPRNTAGGDPTHRDEALPAVVTDCDDLVWMLLRAVEGGRKDSGRFALSMTGSKTLLGPVLRQRRHLRYRLGPGSRCRCIGGRRAGLAARGLVRFGGRRLIQADRGGGVRLAKHGQADDPDIIRPPGPRGVGILQVGKNEVGDAVLRLAPPEDVVRLPGRKDVAALPPGGRFSAHDIDAVHRNDTEDP